MLIFGTIEFGTVNIHGNITQIAIIHHVDAVYPHAPVNVEFFEQHEDLDHVDTDNFDGMVTYTGEAYENKPVQYGVNEDTKTITDIWTLVDMQNLHEDDEIPDDVMWGFMLRCWHKNGTVDDDYIMNCVWEYKTST